MQPKILQKQITTEICEKIWKRDWTENKIRAEREKRKGVVRITLNTSIFLCTHIHKKLKRIKGTRRHENRIMVLVLEKKLI